MGIPVSLERGSTMTMTGRGINCFIKSLISWSDALSRGPVWYHPMSFSLAAACLVSAFPACLYLTAHAPLIFLYMAIIDSM